MYSIRRLNPKDYPNGKQIVYQYTSEKYYEVKLATTENGWSFSLSEQEFELPFEKNLEEDIFDCYKEKSEVYVVEMNGEEAGIVVIQHMDWNHTYLIHHLYVKPRFKRKGVGSALLEFAQERAREFGARMITLETQTSNYPAIQFYLKNGYQLIGLNVNAYSNNDLQKKEVQIEMGLRIENHL